MLFLTLFIIDLPLLSAITSASPIVPLKYNNKVLNLTNPAAAVSSYLLKDTYNSANFFNSFSFFTGDDPTHGFVEYLSKFAVESANLISTANSHVKMHVDHTNVSPSGHASVRITSKKSYTYGLFIADIAHMPSSTCGSWPAFWLLGPNWPNSGEIDIIEGVNIQTTNAIMLYTTPGCVINNAGSKSGTITLEPNCNANGAYNSCSVSTSDTRGYSTGFNDIGGGVYAIQWESSGVYVWFFPRGSVPADIESEAPSTIN